MIKHTGLIALFVRHKVAANLLMWLMILSGIWGVNKLNTQFLPNFALDFVNVQVVWFGASAQDVERSVTIPIEQTLKDVEGVKEMISTSRNGFANIILEFKEGTDLLIALEDVKERVESVRNLPTDAEDPVVKRFERLENIASISVTGPQDLEELRTWLEDFKNELLTRGIARVNTEGLPEKEIRISIPASTIAELALPLSKIGEQINAFSKDIPAGRVGKNDIEHEIRAVQQKRNPQQFRKLPIQISDEGQLLKLEDIADINLNSREDEISLRVDGKPAANMILFRAENADSLKSARIITNWFNETKHHLPGVMKMQIFDEAWKLLKERISLLMTNGIGGLILIIGVLFVALQARVAFWVTASIPVSFLAALAALYLFGGTINMVSLFAFIMSLGIIVDDSIVVGEEIATLISKGERANIAAIEGAKKMFKPVLASSLTTISAFIPLMVIGGIIGNIIFAIPVVVICVIIASLIECFLILPAHISHSFRGKREKHISEFRQKVDKKFYHFRDNKFKPAVSYAIKHKYTTLTAALCVFIIAFSLVLTGRINFTFFPSPDGTVVRASVKFFAGTKQKNIEDYLAQLEKSLQQTNKQASGKEKKDVVKYYNISKNALVNQLEIQEKGDNLASINIELSSPDSRKISNDEFIKKWQQNVVTSPDIESLTIFARRGGPPGDDIDILFYDAKPEVLKQISEIVKQKIQGFAGTYNIVDDMPYGKLQYVFSLNTEGKSLGITLQNIARQISSFYQGNLAQIYHEGQDEIEVRVKLTEEEKNNSILLETLPIITPTQQVVPLIALVDIEEKRGVDILRHTDGELAVHVLADVNEKVNNANKILANLQKQFLPDIQAQYGVKYKFKGTQQDQQETLRDMKRGMLFAALLIYIILAWVFSSYAWPFIVMAVIPFGITGALFGHWIMGLDLTILSLFGIFGLSGIVVNDSIILVSYYKTLRRGGMQPYEAIIAAACARLRAVLLTSITTIAGLTPLLFESSLQAQFLIPMAVSISFGIAFSTVLVLFVIPALLSLYELTIAPNYKKIYRSFIAAKVQKIN